MLLVLPGCGSKISEANYYKVGPGDTEQDVEALLGPGRPVELEGIAGPDRQARRWQRGELTITIIFENGKVISRQAQGLSTGSESYTWPSPAKVGGIPIRKLKMEVAEKVASMSCIQVVGAQYEPALR